MFKNIRKNRIFKSEIYIFAVYHSTIFKTKFYHHLSYKK